MQSFREFSAGPDPFGRTWQVQFKWLQTAISLRHSDSIDVKFRLTSGAEVEEKVIAQMHPDLLTLSARTGQALTDPWVARLAAMHLQHLVATGEDMEKDLVTVLPDQMAGYHSKIASEMAAAR